MTTKNQRFLRKETKITKNKKEENKMLLRTHLAFIVLALILFVPHVSSPILFIFVALIATLLPDVDNAFSTLGRNRGFRALQFFIHHRGFIHSFTFAVAVSIVLAILWPVVSLGFFLGYSLHLFVDSFTKEGIMPFWPWRKRSSWRLRTGSVLETTLFLFLILLDVLLFIVLFWSKF